MRSGNSRPNSANARERAHIAPEQNLPGIPALLRIARGRPAAGPDLRMRGPLTPVPGGDEGGRSAPLIA
jgi:hypothetical protein